jgi:hypothetical protein
VAQGCRLVQAAANTSGQSNVSTTVSRAGQNRAGREASRLGRQAWEAGPGAKLAGHLFGVGSRSTPIGTPPKLSSDQLRPNRTDLKCGRSLEAR